MSARITSYEVRDVRFPTSVTLAGSDALHQDPDYSAAYVILKTDESDLRGHGLTFTIGRGNELCVHAASTIAKRVVGRQLDEIASDGAGFWRDLAAGDTQFSWVGPEKGVIHMALAAVVNAVWDLLAKRAGKPLWKLLCDMSPQELVSHIDFRYITDALEPDEAIDMLAQAGEGRSNRERELWSNGIPAYTTSAGWYGYSDSLITKLVSEAIAEGYQHIKMKVGGNLEADMRRARLIKQLVGPDRVLMMDANAIWDVDEAIESMEVLKSFDPWWIEEPTSCDDILGHRNIAQTVAPIKVATGEHVHNRVMFKQFLQSGAMGICQVDACRLGGVNEVLPVILMADKYGVPVCPHAGGVGLPEYVRHYSAFNFVCLTGSRTEAVTEYVDHLSEHFINPAIVKHGRYVLSSAAGCGVEMHSASLDEHDFAPMRRYEH